MQFKILQENLKKSLSYLQNAIPAKPQLPILSSVYLNIENNILTLAATDLYLGVRTKNRVQTDKDIDLVLPGDTFKKIIYSFDPGEITINQQEKGVKLKSNQSEANIPAQKADEYPDFPEIKGQQFDLPAEFLSKIKELVSFAASTDQARPVLTAVHFKFSPQGLEVVGTDGFRLALLNEPSLQAEEKFTLLVPGKALQQVFRILSQSKTKTISLQVSSEMKQVKFILDNTEVFVRLIDGDYPPYEKIIPEGFSNEVTLDGQKLTQELKRAYILAQEASNIVKLHLKNDELEISAQSPTQGQYKGSIPTDFEGEIDQEIAFNTTYLLDMLNSVKPEEVVFSMNESLKPAMFKLETEPNFKYVVMPFRLNE